LFEANEAKLKKETQTMAKTRNHNIPENESNADKFKRVAGYRLNNVLDDMRTLANCAGPGYEYTEGQKAKITSMLDQALKEVKEAFENGGKARGGRIEL